MVDAKQAESALKDERGSIGAPWGSVEAIEEALEDPENELVICASPFTKYPY